jgi:hypothetical protein
MSGLAEPPEMSSTGLACGRSEHYISSETKMKEYYARVRMANSHTYIPVQMGLHSDDRYELAFPVQYYQQQQPDCQANLPNAAQLN